MGTILYHFPLSAPSRGALLAAKAAGANVDVQIVDLLKKEQLSEDFIKVCLTITLLLLFTNSKLTKCLF